MRLITLRDYQVDIHSTLCRLLRQHPEVLVVGPTGCGKTTITQTVVGSLKGTVHQTHAVILAPQLQIEDSFMPDKDGFEVLIPNKATDGISIIKPVKILPKQNGTSGGWYQLRETEGSRGEDLSTYLTSKDPAYDCVLTTHSGFQSWHKGTLGETFDLKGKILYVDEAHHAGNATGLGEAIQKWLTQGGKVVYITATAFRTDRNTLFEKVKARFIRTMSEHAQDGTFAPEHFILANYNLSMSATNSAEAQGKVLPQVDTSTLESAAMDLAAKWINDGSPKVVVNVPARGSEKWAERLETSFRALGARVINAVGATKEKQEALMQVLREEKKVKVYKDSQVDVILSCKRFDEGTDWPLCSHVYNIGIPSSLGLIIQRWGRAMRLKTGIAGYPVEHVNQACLTFFPLNLAEGVWDSFESYQRDQTYLLCSFLHDHEVAQEYLKDLRWRPEDFGRIRSGKSISNLQDLVNDVSAALQTCLNADVSAEVILETSKIVLKYKEAMGDVNPTDGALLDYATKVGTNADLLQKMKGYLGAKAVYADTAKMVQLVKHIETKILSQGSSGTPGDTEDSGEYTGSAKQIDLIHECLREDFDDVTQNHHHLVSACDGMIAWVSKFTGRDAIKVGTDLKTRLTVIRLTAKQVKDAVKVYVAEKGKGGRRPADKVDASKWCGLPDGTVTFGDLKKCYELDKLALEEDLEDSGVEV